MTENVYGDGGNGGGVGGPQGAPNLSKDAKESQESSASEESKANTEMPARRLERTKDGRMIAGVCSGLGEYMGVDPNILRVALAVVTIFGGAGVAAYVLAWFLIPETGKATSILQDLINKPPKQQP